MSYPLAKVASFPLLALPYYPFTQIYTNFIWAHYMSPNYDYLISLGLLFSFFILYSFIEHKTYILQLNKNGKTPPTIHI